MDLEKANKIYSSIKKLDRFIDIVEPGKNTQRGDGNWDIGMMFKIFTTKKVSIIGTRWFGVGKHIEEIDIPNELIYEIQGIAIKRRDTLKKELKAILDNTNI